MPGELQPGLEHDAGPPTLRAGDALDPDRFAVRGGGEDGAQEVARGVSSSGAARTARAPLRATA